MRLNAGVTFLMRFMITAFERLNVGGILFSIETNIYVLNMSIGTIAKSAAGLSQPRVASISLHVG